MSQMVNTNPATATTKDLRLLLAYEGISTLKLSAHTKVSRTALSTLLNRPEAIDPDFNREVLAAIEKVKAERK